MKKRFVFIVILLITLVFIIVPDKPVESQGTCPTPNLNYYTAFPPFITQTSVPPNVMIVMDNSGSMFRFAYPDGWNSTITNYCTSSGSPCTDFTVGGTWIYPTNEYYGYFDPDYWYTYSSNKFRPAAPKTGSGLSGERAKDVTEWDGNFLNWVTMRRTDVMRKVLTGGLSTGSGASTTLLGINADCDGRGRFKDIANPALYVPTSPTDYSDLDYLRVNTAGGSCNGGGSGTSDFTVVRPGTDETFNVQVIVPPDPEGILQRMWTSLRWGISIYNVNAPDPQGGKVMRHIDKNNTRGDFVNNINNKRPDSNTPLAETLWTDVGYFAQVASWLSGPGPRYNNNDYTINNNQDPYNYGTGGQPQYIPCSKCFILYITDGEPCADGNLPATLSDYAGDQGSSYNCTGTSCPAVGSFSASTLPSCGSGGNVAGIEDVALFMNTNDIRTSATKDLSDTQTLTLYTVFAFAGADSTLLQYASINGGFIDSNSNNLPDLQSEWDKDSDGVPDTYFRASEGGALESSLLAALLGILNRSSSGSAASVIATTGKGEGAIYQAHFVPGDSSTEATWRGYVQGLFVDKWGNLREDDINPGTLDYDTLPTCGNGDTIIRMYFDDLATPPRTRINRYTDDDCDGTADTLVNTVEFDEISTLWEGGKLLWERNASTRVIYTSLDGANIYDQSAAYSSTDSFAVTNADALRPYLRVTTSNHPSETQDIINYIRGDNVSGYRTRSYDINGTVNTWKLGDIIYASPTLVPRPSENYNLLYGDSTYKTFLDQYANRRHVLYVGANDGMLHAFNAGVFDAGPPPNFSYGNGCPTAGAYNVLGCEMWAFIPTELLPHLKWLTDPDYTHVYYVDLEPKVFDARIFNVDATHPDGWGTVLIGGMRFGGKDICVNDDFGSGIEERTFKSSYFALDITDPEQPPRLLWTFTHDNLGLTTSYPAALRVGPKGTAGTWFVTFGSGPTDYDGTSTQQGKIFALEISGGSNGVINSWTAGTNYWESGVNFLTGGSNPSIENYGFMANPTTIDVGYTYQVDVIYVGDTYCDNPINPTDPEACSSSNWKGKMYRIATKPDKVTDPSSDPGDWKLSILFDPEVAAVSDTDIRTGPISAAPTAAMDRNGNLWVYFGTGRFWHADDKALDCIGGDCESWSFFGIKDTCMPWYNPDNTACSSSVTDLYNSTSVDVCGPTISEEGGEYTSCSPLYGTPTKWAEIMCTLRNGTFIGDECDVPLGTTPKSGWYLNFPPPNENDGERVLSKALVAGGLVMWTAYTPNPDDPCAFEGNTRLYATYYTTGTSYYKYVFDQSEGTVLRHIDLGIGVPSAVGAMVTGDTSLMGFVISSTGTVFQKAVETAESLRSGPVGWRSQQGCQQ